MAATLTTPVPALLAVPVVIYSVGRYQRMSAVLLVESTMTVPAETQAGVGA